MNENQQRQTLETTHTYSHNQTLIIHTVVKEIEDETECFAR